MSKDVADFFTKSLKSKNFEIETEMIVKAAKEGYKIGEIPISYNKRDGNSKLNPFIDGFRILKTIFKSAVNKKSWLLNSDVWIYITLVDSIKGISVISFFDLKNIIKLAYNRLNTIWVKP